MVDRSVAVRLSVDASSYLAGMRQASQATKTLARDTEAVQKATGQAMTRQLADIARHNQKVAQAVDQAGASLLKTGAALVAASGFGAKAAIEWESAFAGVRKTVDASEQEYARMSRQLRDLSETMPTTAVELAHIAETAGQLGVAKSNIVAFTKTMADMAETTNLSSEEAASALAQFANITAMPIDSIDRLGSTVVALGNASATTERDIVAMGQRLAGAGSMVGFTQDQIMGVAAALSSVGVEAEAGGTAMSQTFNLIDKAVRQGGASLQLLAEVSGRSSEEFARNWREKPADALGAFIEGLGGMSRSGKDVNRVLDQLNIKGIRQQDALKRLAGAGDLYARSLATAAGAWRENTALADEAGKRYETAESRIKAAWNAIHNAAISLGGAVAPTLATMAELVGKVAKAFDRLPSPVKSAIGALTGIGGVFALASGGVLKLYSATTRMRDTFTTLKTALAGSSAVKSVSKVGEAVKASARDMAALATVSGNASKAVGRSAGVFAGVTAKARAAGGALKSVTAQMRGFVNASGLLSGLKTAGIMAAVTVAVSALAKAYEAVSDAVTKYNGSVRESEAIQAQIEARQGKDLKVADIRGSNGRIQSLTDVARDVNSDAARRGFESWLVPGKQTYDLAVEALEATQKAVLEDFKNRHDPEAIRNYWRQYEAGAVKHVSDVQVYGPMDPHAFANPYRPDTPQDRKLTVDEMVEQNRDLVAGIKDWAQANYALNWSNEEVVAFMRDEMSPQQREAYELALKVKQGVTDQAMSEDQLAEAIRNSVNAYLEQAEAALKAMSAEVSYYGAVDTATEAVKRNGATHDTHTKAGRDNVTALINLTQAAKNYTQELRDAQAPSDEIIAKAVEQYGAFTKTAQAMGYSAEQTRQLAYEYGLIPVEILTQLRAQGFDEASVKAMSLEAMLKVLEKPKTATLTAQVAGAEQIQQFKNMWGSIQNKNVTLKAQTTWTKGGGHGNVPMATGGFVQGPGTGTSDSIPARLSNGEYVIKAESVKRVGVERLNWINRFGSLPRFATGGLVTHRITTPASRDGAPAVVLDGVAISGELTMTNRGAWIDGAITQHLARENTAQASRVRMAGKVNL